MKTDNLTVGMIITCIAALLLGDAIWTTSNPARMVLPPYDVKGITGMTFIVLAGFILASIQEIEKRNPLPFSSARGHSAIVWPSHIAP